MSPIPRILGSAILACVVSIATVRAQTTVRVGALESGDPTLEAGEWFDEFPIDVMAGQELVAIVSSVDFDPYVIAISPSGEKIEVDDFGDSHDVSVIQEVAVEGGTWRIQVTSYESGESGAYALVLTTRRRTDAVTTEEEFVVTGELAAGSPVSGTLEEGDNVREDESWYDGWSLDVTEGDHAAIRLASPDFDTYLTLVSPSGRTFNNDDDGEGGTDSLLEMVFDEPGRWTVVANSLNPGDSGAYTLSVETR